jgi:hypothetical protein
MKPAGSRQALPPDPITQATPPEKSLALTQAFDLKLCVMVLEAKAMIEMGYKWDCSGQGDWYFNAGGSVTFTNCGFHSINFSLLVQLTRYD